MPLAPFLVPIPTRFRDVPELNFYFHNFEIYFNQIQQQFAEAESLIEELQNIVDSIETGGSGGGETDPIDLQEAPLQAGIIGVDQPPSGFFFYTAAGVDNQNFLITLPEFPEENYYLRAQVFLNNTITFDVENNRLLINNSSTAILSGNGNLVDIKYSLSSNRYILT